MPPDQENKPDTEHDRLKIDQRFFNQLKRQDVLNETLDRHHFAAPKPYARIINRDERLRLDRPNWTLCPVGAQVDSVRIYFYSRRKGDFRLCVDLDPHRMRPSYEDETQARKDERTKAQKIKTILLQAIRTRLLQNQELTTRFKITIKSLREIERPYAMTAVKFHLPLSQESTPEEVAYAFSDVIDAVVPEVDRVLKEPPLVDNLFRARQE